MERINWTGFRRTSNYQSLLKDIQQAIVHLSLEHISISKALLFNIVALDTATSPKTNLKK